MRPPPHRRSFQARALATLLVSPLSWLAGPGHAFEAGQSLPDCPALRTHRQETSAVTADATRVLVIDFWASWCAPCRQAMPFLDALQAELSARGLRVLAINVDEDGDAAARFLKEHPVAYTVLFDPAGECARAFMLPAMPSTYVVSADGLIQAVHHGFRRGDAARIRASVLSLM
ncbi:MAG: TlpA family protein disulfide reductase [Gammaproteobacteria bacterium]|nr:TlpA family protein disulfide reductase [Gammaproteobacteria bacterium]